MTCDDGTEGCGGCKRSIKHYDTSKILTVKPLEDLLNKDGKCECRDEDGDQRTPDKCVPIEQCQLLVTFEVTIPKWGGSPGDRFLEEEYIDPIKGAMTKKWLPFPGGQSKNPLKLKMVADGCGDKKERVFSVCEYGNQEYPAYKRLGTLQLQVECGWCEGECPDKKDPDPPDVEPIS